MNSDELKVFESNELIRKSSCSMTLLQQKVLRYLISQIGPYDKPDKIFSVKVFDVCKVCGMNTTDSKTYVRIVKDIVEEGLTKTLGWLNGEEQLAWLRNEVKIVNGIMYYQYHPIVQPHLFELKEKFTGYQLLNVLYLQSKHAIRLFEILKSYESLGKCELEIDDLKKELGVTYKKKKNEPWKEKYPNFYDFDRRVLKPAHDEINLVCQDFSFSYRVGSRENRKAKTIIFQIRPKDPKSEETRKATEERMRRSNKANCDDTKK